MLPPKKGGAISIINPELLSQEDRQFLSQNPIASHILSNNILKYCPELEYYCSHEEYADRKAKQESPVSEKSSQP